MNLAGGWGGGADDPEGIPRSLCSCRHQLQYEGIGIPPPKMLVTPRSSFELGGQSQDGERVRATLGVCLQTKLSESSILEISCSLSFVVLERLANTCPFYFLSRSILK